MRISNQLRYTIIMVAAILMNFLLFKAAKMLNLPLWLDTSGTIFSAIALEPAAGLLVGLVNNFYIAIEMRDCSSLIYYSISASAALIAGILMRKNGKIEWKRSFMVIILLIVVSSFLSAVITFWRNDGISESYWENYFANLSSRVGLYGIYSEWAGTFIVKVFDCAASFFVAAVTFAALPKILKNPED